MRRWEPAWDSGDKGAEHFAKQFKLKLPVLLDTIDDAMEKNYTGWPDRLYVIDAVGKIAHKGGPGPRGLKTEDVSPVLEKLLKKQAANHSASRNVAISASGFLVMAGTLASAAG